MIWKMIILNHMNDGEEVMTNDREEVQIYPTENEEERATIEGLKDQAYLDWLDQLQTMMSNEEKVLVERTEDRVYIDRFLSDEDEVKIEASLKSF